MFETVLFPGRHHAFTRFQWAELRAVLDGNWVSLSGRRIRCEDGAAVVVAITSADLHSTRRDPVPGHLRAAQAHLAGHLEGVPTITSLVPEIAGPEPAVPDELCARLLAHVRADPTQPRVIDPTTTVVASSDPGLGAAFARSGYEIVPLELGDLGPLADVARSLDALHPERTPTIAARASRVVELAAAGGEWMRHAHPASVEIWRAHDLDGRCRELSAEPNLDGDVGEAADR